jgi:hypothetical protein
MKFKLISVAVLSLMALGLGCATTGRPQVYSEAEMELAQQRAEDATLSQMAASNNNDIADAASTLARERATR